MKSKFFNGILGIAFLAIGVLSFVPQTAQAQEDASLAGEDCSKNGFRTITPVIGGSWASLCNCDSFKGAVGEDCK